MKKIFLHLSLTLVSIIGFSSAASASLVGSTIFLSHRYPDISTSIQSFPVIVQPGTGDRNIFGSIYTSDPESDAILVNFFRPFTFENVPFTGHVGEFIPEPIQSVNIDTNMSGWNDSRLSFTGNSFAFNWADLSVQDDTYFYATLNFSQSQAPIPEPATALLFMLGAGGALFRFSRKKSTK